MQNITRVLVANRGEIALRIIRACRALGVEAVLAASDPDRDSLPAREADRTICIGSAPPRESYLKIDTLLSATLGTALHHRKPIQHLVEETS